MSTLFKMHPYLPLLFLLCLCRLHSFVQAKLSPYEVSIFFQFYSIQNKTGQFFTASAKTNQPFLMNDCKLPGTLSDEMTFVIHDIPCGKSPAKYNNCMNYPQIFTLYLQLQAFAQPLEFVIIQNVGRLRNIVQQVCAIPLLRASYNLSGTVNLTSFGSFTKPNYPASAKTSLFTIVFLSVCVLVTFGLGCIWSLTIYYRRYEQHRAKKKLREAMARSVQEILSKSPVLVYDSNQRENVTREDEDPTCAICLETFKSGEKLRKLVCSHSFHLTCIDPWLLTRQLCPLCNRNILRNSIPSISSSVMLGAAERNPAYTNLAEGASAPIENSNL